MDLIEIVPTKLNGTQGVAIILDPANYDAWLQKEGPDLLAEGFVRLIKKAHIHYEDQQLRGRR